MIVAASGSFTLLSLGLIIVISRHKKRKGARGESL
jgi:hypothetical protein